MKHKSFCLGFVMFASLAVAAQGGSKLHLLNSFAVSGAGGWDYLAVGPVHDWLYVSHGTQVNVINKKTGDSVAVIENTTGVHGIAFDPTQKKGFTSNGRLNSVFVFDMNTNKVSAEIHTGANPDAIMYEPYSKKIITCNGRGKNLSIIDPVTNKLIDSVELGGKPETAVSDGSGKLFINIEDKNEIVVVDTKTFKVSHHWSLGKAEGPTGLAIDTKTKRLFSTCDLLLVVMNADDGTIVDKLPIGDGCDGVVFDEAQKNIYTANGEGTITVIHEDNKSSFHVTDNIKTKKSARTIAIDGRTHKLYLPAAEYEPVQPGEKRGKVKPGTFQVLVMGE